MAVRVELCKYGGSALHTCTYLPWEPSTCSPCYLGLKYEKKRSSRFPIQNELNTIKTRTRCISHLDGRQTQMPHFKSARCWGLALGQLPAEVEPFSPGPKSLARELPDLEFLAHRRIAGAQHLSTQESPDKMLPSRGLLRSSPSLGLAKAVSFSCDSLLLDPCSSSAPLRRLSCCTTNADKVIL